MKNDQNIYHCANQENQSVISIDCNCVSVMLSVFPVPSEGKKYRDELMYISGTISFDFKQLKDLNS